MPVTIEWDNAEHTIIHRAFIGAWTWDEYYAADAEMRQLLSTVPHKVDVITDLTGSSLMMPEGTVSEARKIVANMPPNRGDTIAIGASAIVKLFIAAFRQTYGDQTGLPSTSFVANLEEARAFLQERRTQAMP